MSILFSSHNLNPWNLFDSLFQDVDECQAKENPGRNLPHEALVYCIEACYFSISWGLYYIENNCETSQIEESVKELRSSLDKFMFASFELTRDGPTDEIQEAVSLRKTLRTIPTNKMLCYNFPLRLINRYVICL